MVSMSMRLPEELVEKLDALADATGRTKSFLAVQAIRDYLEREAWQVAEIKRGLQEADAGDFATAAEMAEMDNKWGYSGR